nr:MAG TPA: hypothetical protein [Caudoviricetes sp.]
MRYFCGVVTGMFVMAFVIMMSFNLTEKNNTNKVEHIKTGDIDWVCIDNGDYTRSCDVIQKYQ